VLITVAGILWDASDISPFFSYCVLLSLTRVHFCFSGMDSFHSLKACFYFSVWSA
jgi:hypothetical protein